MTPSRPFLFLVPGLALLATACATPVAPATDDPPAAAARPASPPAAEPSPDYRLIMGELALARGEHSAASAQYLAAASELDDPAVARRATLIALLAADTVAAERAADRWEQLAPHDLEAAQYQALLHARAGRTETALQYLLRVADGATGAMIGANLQGITALLAGEPNPWRSASLMARLAAMRPEHPEGWYGAALLAVQADRPAQAVELATRALALDPNLLDARFLRARARLLVRPGQDGRD
ncbi:MAG TPA: hypothetical protein VF267_05970, partial [Gammaproteobacteria bacterium]